MAKKLLVTGISGLLGAHIGAHQQTDWQITGLYHQRTVQLEGVDCQPLNLCDQPAVDELMEDLQPDAILHLAALSHPNRCAQEPALSYAINVAATGHLAQWSKQLNIPFIFSSTDLVFDGEQAPYGENDATAPVNQYGQQKVEAEALVRQIYPAATIARLPLMYGITPGVKAWFGAWLETLQSGGSIKAFTDEYRTPASCKAVAEGLFLLLQKEVSGLWHLGGKERISRYDFAMKMATVFGLPKDNIEGSLQSEVVMAAARPPDVSLDSRKAMALGYKPGTIIDNLEQLKPTII